MQLTIQKRDFLRALQRMQGVANHKSTMPVLSSVLLEASSDGALCMSSTDLFLSLVTEVKAEVAKPGSVALAAKDLLERVKMMPDGPVSLAVGAKSEATLKASGSARRYTLRGMPGGDFPPIQRNDDGSPSMTLSASALLDLIDRTLHAVSTDETRAHLNSALFDWDGNRVRMVATNGYRLAMADVTVAGSASTSMLLPLKALHELRRICDEAKASGNDANGGPPMLSIARCESSAFFSFAGATFGCKLVDAQFPPYQQVIPQASKLMVVAPLAPMAEAVKAVSVSADAKTGGIHIALSKGMMRISSGSPDGGDGVDELSVDYDGPSMTVGFNAKYVLDSLASLRSSDVAIGLGCELDPAVMRPSGDHAHIDMICVIMPMRV